MTRFPLILLLASLTICLDCGFGIPEAQDRTISIGSIDYFGYQGLDLPQFVSHLPVHLGESITRNGFGREQVGIQATARKFTGKPATDIAGVCCDSKHRLQIYIGLSGTSSHALALMPTPQGHEHLDDRGISLYHQYLTRLENAVQNGVATEHHTNGYSLSDDPSLRRVELEIRAYALSHAPELEHILATSSDVQQRRSSAYLLGYAKRSTDQIHSLTEATRDPDKDVRNNALRALWVLASAREKGRIEVSAKPFIDFLFSGQWSDRNKSSLLLEQLTRKRDPHLLRELRDHAMTPLIEGANWTDPGHCDPFLAILGRIGGIPEARLQMLINGGDKSQIINAAQHSRAYSER